MKMYKLTRIFKMISNKEKLSLKPKKTIEHEKYLVFIYISIDEISNWEYLKWEDMSCFLK